MHTKLTAPLSKQIVLLWFVAFVAVATFASVFKTVDLQTVCTGQSLSVSTDQTSGDAKDHGALKSTMDCPLCLPAMAASTHWGDVSLPQLLPLAPMMTRIVAAHIAWLTAPPLPSRGPPVSL